MRIWICLYQWVGIVHKQIFVIKDLYGIKYTNIAGLVSFLIQHWRHLHIFIKFFLWPHLKKLPEMLIFIISVTNHIRQKSFQQKFSSDPSICVIVLVSFCSEPCSKRSHFYGHATACRTTTLGWPNTTKTNQVPRT